MKRTLVCLIMGFLIFNCTSTPRPKKAKYEYNEVDQLVSMLKRQIESMENGTIPMDSVTLSSYKNQLKRVNDTSSEKKPLIKEMDARKSQEKDDKDARRFYNGL